MVSETAESQKAQLLNLRKGAGVWLRDRREEIGLSQADLAKLVGADYYSFISQIENGRGKIPSDRFLVWANSLRVPPKSFVEQMLKYYDPQVYSILFADGV
jgi:transcriptional regulator with XRE-family HTH domain